MPTSRPIMLQRGHPIHDKSSRYTRGFDIAEQRDSTGPYSPDVRPLGTRLAARFKGVGLSEPIPELSGQAPRPAELEP